MEVPDGSTRCARPSARSSKKVTTNLRPAASPSVALSSLPARVLFSETYISVSRCWEILYMKPLPKTLLT